MKIAYFGLDACGTMPGLGKNVLVIAATNKTERRFASYK